MRAYFNISFGLALTFALTAVAWGLEQLELSWFGQVWFESLVLALILGTVARTIFGLHPIFNAGVKFASKTLLEIGVMLLGAAFSAEALSDFGWVLIVTIAGVVFVSLGVSYNIGRALGLSKKMATLIACGNSICGNSAIMAAAPVIDATADDVAASITFTAALGIIVVLLLPALVPLLGLSQHAYGLFAGMTVYAVPQVLAATAPIGVLAVQVGTLAKLMRVLMLGPVIIALRLLVAERDPAGIRITRLVPWFIVGFLGLLAARSFSLIPEILIEPIGAVATLFTVAAMGALGLSVDLRTMMHANGRVFWAGVLSLVALGTVSGGALMILGLGA